MALYLKVHLTDNGLLDTENRALMLRNIWRRRLLARRGAGTMAGCRLGSCVRSHAKVRGQGSAEAPDDLVLDSS